MFSPATIGILGAVTGIVGAISGSVGSVLGWTNYRRLQQIKALDLRLELRKQVSDVRAVVEALPDRLERSRASGSAVLAAMGALRSSTASRWISSLPGLKRETWGTQSSWLNYQITRTRY
jgi:hypothetical protein